MVKTFQTIITFYLVSALVVCVGESFQFQHQQFREIRSNDPADLPQANRKEFLCGFSAAFLALACAPEESHAKSYSSNARNLERMNSGDMSGGSVYDNNPTSLAGKKRRAMVGCKNAVAREEAAQSELKISELSEMECNQMVLGGETDFMLQALQNLDCPTCPYGISSKRKI